MLYWQQFKTTFIPWGERRKWKEKEVPSPFRTLSSIQHSCLRRKWAGNCKSPGGSWNICTVVQLWTSLYTAQSMWLSLPHRHTSLTSCPPSSVKSGILWRRQGPHQHHAPMKYTTSSIRPAPWCYNCFGTSWELLGKSNAFHLSSKELS